MADADPRALDAIFVPAQIAPAYQPVVDLTAGQVIGAEALARWPRLAVTPDQAFAYARARRRSADLDALCQRAALHSAAGATVPDSFDLFVNVAPDAGVDALVATSGSLQVVADLSARALDTDPEGFLADVAQLRSRGVGISLGHVDASDGTLAFLPFLAPDVVRINLAALLRRNGHQAGKLLDAVASYASRTGATVLAEGIETESQATAATRFGATLGQGWWFGHPGPLPVAVGTGGSSVPLLVGGDHADRQRRALAERDAWAPLPERAGSTLTERLIAAMGAPAA
ncbi:MAG TPA: EAL domain-containing protein [Acidimicrobiales bacterium]|nr:EAL domain-containing protein [Acidimicrobiales bacterium]